MIDAILAAEDERFIRMGVDCPASARGDQSSVGDATGAGTITMQVARNFPDSREDDHSQMREVLLAGRSKPTCPRPTSNCTSTRAGQRAYGRGGGPSTSARRCATCLRPRRPCSLACRKLHRPQSRQQPETCENSAIVCAKTNARSEVHQFRAIPGSTNRATRRPGRAAMSCPRTPNSSPKWPAKSFRRLRRRRLHQRSDRKPRSGRPTRKPLMLQCGAA
jgi:hypothetical protein